MLNCEHKIENILDQKFDLSSQKSLQTLLFKKIKIQNEFEFKFLDLQNLPKITLDYLRSFEQKNPIIDIIIKYKLLAYCLEKIKELSFSAKKKDSEDYFVHSNWSIYTKNGRIQSIDPEIQNVKRQSIFIDESNILTQCIQSIKLQKLCDSLLIHQSIKYITILIFYFIQKK